MNIVVSTIFRDSSAYIERWAAQLEQLKKELGCKMTITAYENDSVDDTVHKILYGTNFGAFDDFIFVHDKIGTTKYQSTIKAKRRVQNLANARNHTISQALPEIQKADLFICVENEVTYDPKEAAELIRRSIEYDILSGISVVDDTNEVYDTWAQRPMLAKKAKGHWNTIYLVDSTFHCFCCYNPIPILNGVRFGWRVKDSFDCDTVVICNKYRETGYTKIGVDYSVRISHPSQTEKPQKLPEKPINLTPYQTIEHLPDATHITYGANLHLPSEGK